jgi:hypothetical protein
MQFFAVILALLKAIPTLQKYFDQFLAWYVEREIASIKKEYRDAIERALASCDQRPIEEAMGNHNAGSIAPHAGTSIVDSLPGVPK